MNTKLVPDLADGLKEYFSDGDLTEHCQLFDVAVYLDGTRSTYFGLSKRLILEVEHGNNRRCLESLVGTLLSRVRERVAHTDFERRDHHSEMLERLLPLESALAENPLPTELSVSEQKPFTAKSHLREFLGLAAAPVVVVDNYVGAGTLDCLRDVKFPIRLLTGSSDRSISPGFDLALHEFVEEGFRIEVRRHPKLHDRYICFSDRIWLVGSSIKDAGRKTLNVIECVDGRSAIQADVEAKWSTSSPYP